MDKIELSAQRWPLLYIESVGVPADTAFAQFLRDYKRQLDRRAPFAVVLDARKSGNTPASQRNAMTNWMRENSGMLSTYCLGVAFAIDSVLVRMILREMLLVQPMPMPHVVFATVEEAERWCRERLRRADAQPSA